MQICVSGEMVISDTLLLVCNRILSSWWWQQEDECLLPFRRCLNWLNLEGQLCICTFHYT